MQEGSRDKTGNMLRFANIDTNIQGLMSKLRNGFQVRRVGGMLCHVVLPCSKEEVVLQITAGVERPGPVDVSCPNTDKK